MLRTNLPCAMLLCFAAAACSADETSSPGPTTTATSTVTSSTTSSGGSGTGGAGAQGGGPVGGAGGVGGATGGVGGTGGAPVIPCTWSATANDCGQGMYCDAPGCAAGSCVGVPAIASEKSNLAPVCGCDGVTYWNAKVASSHGMAVSTDGECTATAKQCGGFANIQCDAGSYCNLAVPDASGCNIADLGGTCWALPAVCPTIGIGPITRGCGDAMCTEECELIKAGSTWYVDNTCPQ